MKSLKLKQIRVDLNPHTGDILAICRLNDTRCRSSLHPVVEQALLESPTLLDYVAEQFEAGPEEPEELDFSDD